MKAYTLVVEDGTLPYLREGIQLVKVGDALVFQDSLLGQIKVHPNLVPYIGADLLLKHGFLNIDELLLEVDMYESHLDRQEDKGALLYVYVRCKRSHSYYLNPWPSDSICLSHERISTWEKSMIMFFPPLSRFELWDEKSEPHMLLYCDSDTITVEVYDDVEVTIPKPGLIRRILRFFSKL